MFNILEALKNNLQRPRPLKTERINTHMPSRAMIYSVLDSKPIGADVNFSYPTAEIAVMGADGAVNILYRKATAEEKAKAVEEYKEKFSNPYRAAEQGYIDEIILPKDTRYKLIQALEMTQNKSVSNPPKKHGNMPL